MIKTDGPGLFLSDADCVLLDRALRDALKFAWLGRRAIPPHALVVLADLVHSAAEEYRPCEDRTRTPTSRTGPVSTTIASTSTASEETEVLLPTAEAARRLGVSAGYLRKLARRSAIPAEAGAGDSGWRFRRTELDAWDAHRKENERKAA